MSMDKKVPEIRYKGFNDQWQEREFSHFATRVSTHHQSTCLACVEYEDIVAGKGIFNKDIQQKKNFKAGLKFEAGDVVFGKLRPYLKNWFLADFEGLAVGDFWVLRANNVASTFLFSLIQTNRFEFISNLSAGSKMPRSDWGLVSTSCFFVPKNISESNEIGDYFQKLDALINQHQQKHDKLCKFKKSMLEKMFPKQGKTMPEIRFKGFSGEWEEKELGELAEIVRGASPRPIEDPKWFDNQSSVGWLRIRDVTEQDGRIHYLEQRISKLGQEKTRVLHEKHLLLSIAASVGKPVVNYVQTGVHDGFLIFKKPLFELEFMYQWLKSFEAKWQQFGQPGSQVNLNSDIVKSQTVTIPTKEEQIAIGNYFKKLDDLINRHQQQITKLNNIKQACLSKMFV
ncbi:restriction endonuclease subunit S [Klebsiella aerogenes]|nr:restriction endonuclease subunit S [Klebsiella aerogenes]